jgi:hypothetical protein
MTKAISNKSALKYAWARNGRKYRGMMLVFLSLLVGFCLSMLNPVLITLYPHLTGSILVGYAIYCGGNVASKFMARKYGLQEPILYNSPPPIARS